MSRQFMLSFTFRNGRGMVSILLVLVVIVAKLSRRGNVPYRNSNGEMRKAECCVILYENVTMGRYSDHLVCLVFT
mgnify:CR=1 FL=1